jgi:hypothetical protein
MLLCYILDVYSETCRNQTSLGPTCVLGIDRFWSIQVMLTNISLIGTLSKVGHIQDSGLFRVRFRQVSLYMT